MILIKQKKYKTELKKEKILVQSATFAVNNICDYRLLF